MKKTVLKGCESTPTGRQLERQMRKWTESRAHRPLGLLPKRRVQTALSGAEAQDGERKCGRAAEDDEEGDLEQETSESAQVLDLRRPRTLGRTVTFHDGM